MNFKQRLIYSALFASAMLIISLLFPIIPCQSAPNVPNPEYSWSMCRLNPDTTGDLDSAIYYLGYTKSITEGYFIVLILSFAIAFAFLHFTRRKKKKK